jgi:hypothetical protein
VVQVRYLIPDFNHIFGKVNDNEMKRDDDDDDDAQDHGKIWYLYSRRMQAEFVGEKFLPTYMLVSNTWIMPLYYYLFA